MMYHFKLSYTQLIHGENQSEKFPSYDWNFQFSKVYLTILLKFSKNFKLLESNA